MVKIGILHHDNSGYEEKDWLSSTFTNEKIREFIKDSFETVNVSKLNDLGVLINNVLSPAEGDTLDIQDFYYNDEYVLQALFISHHNDSSQHYNFLATQLLYGNYANKPVIIIKRCVTLGNSDYIDVSLEDMVVAVKNIFAHKGIIISENGEIREFEYIRHPLEWRNVDDNMKNIRYHEFKVGNYIFTFFVNINCAREKTNTKASVVYNKRYMEKY